MAVALSRLVHLIGEASVAVLCERLGGTRVYVPACPSSASRLVLAIGHAPAARLCDAMPGTYLDVPSRLSLDRSRRRAAVRYDLARGLSPAEVAARHGLTTQHVRTLRTLCAQET
jgi:hypothetical protein